MRLSRSKQPEGTLSELSTGKCGGGGGRPRNKRRKKGGGGGCLQLHNYTNKQWCAL
jgi:hypothetical protein